MVRWIAAVVFALSLFPMSAFADAELRGTVLRVNHAEKQLVVRTDKGEETLLFGSSTQGMGNAREGMKVTIKYSEKDGQPRVIAITPLEGGTVQIAPR
ncbi:MAG TPA: hypothetical protein VGL11_03840 [Candidatus Binatia bacterium]|jgi:hypothetical protein